MNTQKTKVMAISLMATKSTKRHEREVRFFIGPFRGFLCFSWLLLIIAAEHRFDQLGQAGIGDQRLVAELPHDAGARGASGPLHRGVRRSPQLVRIDAAVRAPAGSGSLLAWNQAVLHWGGRASRLASGPRASWWTAMRCASGNRMS